MDSSPRPSQNRCRVSRLPLGSCPKFPGEPSRIPWVAVAVPAGALGRGGLGEAFDVLPGRLWTIFGVCGPEALPSPAVPGHVSPAGEGLTCRADPASGAPPTSFLRELPLRDSKTHSPLKAIRGCRLHSLLEGCVLV